MTKQLLEQALEAILEARTTYDGVAKWDRNYRAADALKAAIASWSESINCRTCTKYNALKGRCMSVIKCEGGRLYDGSVEVKCYE